MFFLVGQVPIKNYGLKTQFFSIQHVENRKSFNEVLSPGDQINHSPYSCSFTFHTSYQNGIIGYRGGEGRCQNAQKQLALKTFLKLILYKPVINFNLQWHVSGL